MNWPLVLTRCGLTASRTTGGVYYLKCIFHEEKNASLALRPSGRFVCYGCNTHGDVAAFLAAYGVEDDALIEQVLTTPDPLPNKRQLSLL